MEIVLVHIGGHLTSNAKTWCTVARFTVGVQNSPSSGYLSSWRYCMEFQFLFRNEHNVLYFSFNREVWVNIKLAIGSIWPGKFLASFLGCLTMIVDFATVSILTLYCAIVSIVVHMFRHLNTSISTPKLSTVSSSDWLRDYLENRTTRYPTRTQFLVFQ